MRRIIAILTLLMILATCSAQVKTITDVINSNPSFSMLASLLQASGLQKTLSLPVNYTVFAPNNTAFNALPNSTLQTLRNPANVDLLRSVLLYHVSTAL